MGSESEAGVNKLPPGAKDLGRKFNEMRDDIRELLVMRLYTNIYTKRRDYYLI
jgi:hypothetical protein